MIKLLLRASLFILICFVVFIITSGDFFKKDIEADKSKLNTNEKINNEVISYEIVDLDVGKKFSLVTDFEYDEDKYIAKESDLDVSELTEALKDVKYRADVIKVLKEDPEVLEGGYREDVFMLGYFETYDKKSKRMENYKSDIENGFLDTLIVVKYNKEREIIDLNILNKSNYIISSGKK